MSHLKITLRELRRIISEEVDRLVRRSAGFGGGAGIGGRGRGSIETPPLGLGDETEQEEETHGKEQEKSQYTIRVDGKRGIPSR